MPRAPDAPSTPDSLQDSAATLLAAEFGAGPLDAVGFAPGRVNLIGEHVDYNDGLVLPMPLAAGTAVAVRRQPGRELRVASRDPGDAGRYVAALFAALRAAGHALPPCAVAVAGDLPVGAGLSSSASLLVASARAVTAAFALPLDDAAHARVAHRAETDGVGVACGIMDHVAIASGRPRHALFLDCRDQSFTNLPLPAELAVLVIDSGTRRELTASLYNERVADCRAAAAALGVASLRDLTAADLERRVARLPPRVANRARHVVTEIARVAEFATALARGDLARCGTLVNESHASCRDRYEISTPLVDRLQQSLVATPGILGARLTGAGFGGCLVALAERRALPAIAAAGVVIRCTA